MVRVVVSTGVARGGLHGPLFGRGEFVGAGERQRRVEGLFDERIFEPRRRWFLKDVGENGLESSQERAQKGKEEALWGEIIVTVGSVYSLANVRNI